MSYKSENVPSDVHPNEDSNQPVHSRSLINHSCPLEKPSSLAFQNASSEDFDQTTRIVRLI